jgi:asparagine synthase (glutamine-hydrolysing)
LRQRRGWLERRVPATPWEEQPLSCYLKDPEQATSDNFSKLRQTHGACFFFSPQDRPLFRDRFSKWDSNEVNPVAQAERLGEGEFRYFQCRPIRAGFPPDWHRNALTGDRAPDDRHWSRIDDFDYGDIKGIWEPNRFGFAYTLVRAYWRTGRIEFAETFWQLVEDWHGRNPPQLGPNWKCGQEIALRLMAWCFALHGFLDATATTPARVSLLGQMIAVSAGRIEACLDYALSQRNNHGITEAVGLWTTGLLFPQFRRAEVWRETGRAALEQQARELIYEDGSFAQHSANYHRVMLHDYLWALRLGALHAAPLSEALRSRVGMAADFLLQIQDGQTGRVPCYGHNDGALVLPLSNCDYQDFRPVVQATRYAMHGVRTFPAGPWDEDLLWLFGPAAADAPMQTFAPLDLAAGHGGCYTLRAKRGFVFIHCPRFRHRPSQADALHVDVWWRGQNMALDAGTYSYNAPAPWDKALERTECHNTVVVDGQDQMERAGRFLWLPWLHARRRCQLRSQGGTLAYWEGEHDGYRRLRPAVRHRRAVVRLGDEHWLVLDRLESNGEHQYRLHWLVADYPARSLQDQGQLALSTPGGDYHLQMGSLGPARQYSLVRADESSTRGWRSPYYCERQPALSWALQVAASSCWLWSLLGPEQCVVHLEGGLLRVRAGSWQTGVQLGGASRLPLVQHVQWEGESQERLEVSECTSC